MKVAALIILVTLALWLARRHGDLAPALLFLAAAAFVVFAVPKFPGSPIACLDVKPKGCTTSRQTDWLMALAFLVPLVVSGTWHPLRRLLGRR